MVGKPSRQISKKSSWRHSTRKITHSVFHTGRVYDERARVCLCVTLKAGFVQVYRRESEYRKTFVRICLCFLRTRTLNDDERANSFVSILVRFYSKTKRRKFAVIATTFLVVRKCSNHFISLFISSKDLIERSNCFDC